MNPSDLFGLFMTGAGVFISLCIGGILVAVIAVVGVILYRNSQKGSAERKAAQSWPVTQGTILSSSIKWQRASDDSDEQYSEVVYQYQVNGKTYQGQTVKAGERFLKVRMPGEDQALVKRYPAGASVKVYYDAANPADAALER